MSKWTYSQDTNEDGELISTWTVLGPYRSSTHRSEKGCLKEIDFWEKFNKKFPWKCPRTKKGQ